MTGQDGLSSSLVETVAGFTAGIVSTFCLHPLDLVKTRLQGKPALPRRWSGIIRSCATLLQLIDPRPRAWAVRSGWSAGYFTRKAASPHSTGA